jgi:fatty acid/phospholipid biosynthesis enzyme
MADCDLRNQILQLEAQIEELTELMKKCRKAILIAKIAVAVGGILLLAMTLGIIWLDPMALIGAIVAVLGGIVVFGSNTSTSKQAAVAIKAAEALRAQLIDKIDPHLVYETAGRQIRH